MFEEIQKHRQAVRENIKKSFQISYTESDDFEKAHQVGDIHPNGKWVWTQLPSGKFDWRVIKKTAPGSGAVAPDAKQQSSQKSTLKSSSVDVKKDEKKKAISPTDSEICAMSFDEAKKLGKVDVSAVDVYKVPTTLKKCKFDLAYLRDELDFLEHELKRALETGIGEKFYEFKSDAEKVKKIREISNKLATKEVIEKRIMGVQSDLNKKKKQFLSETEEDFTEKEVQRWLDEFNAAQEPAAIVDMYRSSIRVGNGKEKPFTGRRWDNPNWRPIGMIKYNVANWNSSELIPIKIPIQSWDDVQKNLDGMKTTTLFLYKHPKQ